MTKNQNLILQNHGLFYAEIDYIVVIEFIMNALKR